MFGVLDTIKSIKPEVQTYGLGACYSYASLILVSLRGLLWDHPADAVGVLG